MASWSLISCINKDDRLGPVGPPGDICAWRDGAGKRPSSEVKRGTVFVREA